MSAQGTYRFYSVYRQTILLVNEEPLGRERVNGLKPRPHWATDTPTGLRGGNLRGCVPSASHSRKPGQKPGKIGISEDFGYQVSEKVFFLRRFKRIP